MGVCKGIDPGEYLPLVAAAFAVLDADIAAAFERVQMALDGPSGSRIELGEVFVGRIAEALGFCQAADLRIKELRAGRNIRVVPNRRRNDCPIAGLQVFYVSSPLFGDADADAESAPASDISIFS